MVYIINNYRGTQIAEIPDGSIDTTSTSLKLVGRNFTNYGQVIDENLVNLLEHFASTVPPSGNILEGQIWYNTKTFTINVFNGQRWVDLGGVSYGAVRGNPNLYGDGPDSLPPVGASEGDLYWDTSCLQLWGWTNVGSPRWVLIGQIAPYASIPTISLRKAAMVYTQISNIDVLEMIVDTNPIAVWSKFGAAPPHTKHFPPSWNTAQTLPNGTAGTNYSVQLSATDPQGATVTYTVDSGTSSPLPAGLALSSSGLLSGILNNSTIASSPNYFTIDATSTYGTTSQQFNLTVTA